MHVSVGVTVNVTFCWPPQRKTRVTTDRVRHIALHRAVSRKFEKSSKFSSRVKAKSRKKKSRVKGDPPIQTTKQDTNMDTCFQST
jgi:hypothetical protein